MENNIKELVISSEVISKDVSQLPNAESLLVDVKGDKGEFAKRLAEDLGVKVGNLPGGEKTITP